MEITVIGGGLAGSEAAYQVARKGGRVQILEMRPHAMTPAHRTGDLGELVCSNSLKSQELTNAHGLLKAEMASLGSLVVRSAEATAIPGGKALVVDRTAFAGTITKALLDNPRIKVRREKVEALPKEGIVIVATGPLTEPVLCERIGEMTGAANHHFFDAVSPIIDGTTIDMEHAFFASRYDAEGDDYLNCPLTSEEYDQFYEALMNAERVDLREFEKETPYFEGCLPIEVMAQRGKNTLAFGPMKPVGLIDRRTGRREAYAIIQLRREDRMGTMYNMVGFQTKLTYPEQERVFRLVPALRNATFFRHGSVHRNTFINAPAVLDGLQMREERRIFFAGQITGVEGYMESTAMGLLAGIAALYYERGKGFKAPGPETAIGALYRYISTERKDYQPMNVNWGLVEGYDKRKKGAVAERALRAIGEWERKVQEDLGTEG